MIFCLDEEMERIADALAAERCPGCSLRGRIPATWTDPAEDYCPVDFDFGARGCPHEATMDRVEEALRHCGAKIELLTA